MVPSRRKQIVLEALDGQIEELEKKLRAMQPLSDELKQLKAARRALLSEGASHPRAQLSVHDVSEFMRARGNIGVAPLEIAEALDVPGASVRSHLSRHGGRLTRTRLTAGSSSAIQACRNSPSRA
jgi:DNA-directed RNA polymerase specialized sigma24 family protein